MDNTELLRIKKELQVTRLSCIITCFIWFFLCFLLYNQSNKNFTIQIQDTTNRIEKEMQSISSNLSDCTTAINTKADIVDCEDLKERIDRLEKTDKSNPESVLKPNCENNTAFPKEAAQEFVSDAGETKEALSIPVEEFSESSTVYVHDTMKSDGHISKEYFDSVAYYYDMVPEVVRYYFSLDEWKVSVVSRELHWQGIASRIVALTVYDDKTIYISTHDASSILHEMGHYIDWRTDCSNLLDPSIYSEELQGLLTIDGATDSHNYINAEEYFAESFSLYVLKPEELKEYCPRTYSFITALLYG